MSEPHERESFPHIRRQPTGPIPTGDDARTNIIRRAPTAPEQPTTLIAASELAGPSTRTAIAAAAAAILSGWPTAVVAGDLISGWWDTDRLFCLAVAFLTAVFAASTVAGVILLLLRRPVGCYLIAFGSALALLTFGSVFITGARVAWPVYLIPLLPLTALALSLLPATRRWAAGAD